jgi:hypothetical protein
MTTQVAEVAEAVPGAVEELEEAIVLIDECVEDLPDDEIAYARALQTRPGQARHARAGRADPGCEREGRRGTRARDARMGARAGGQRPLARGGRGVQQADARERDALGGAHPGVRGEGREAKDLFSVAATSFPEADLSMYIEYCDAKIAALEISKKADEAFLANQPAQANTLERPVQRGREGARQKAAELPASPAVPIAAAYQDLAGEATALYFQARAQATEADARLREADGANASGEGG